MITWREVRFLDTGDKRFLLGDELLPDSTFLCGPLISFCNGNGTAAKGKPFVAGKVAHSEDKARWVGR